MSVRISAKTVRTTGAATTKVDVPRRSLPSPHPQARSPILGGSEGRFKATAGNCLPPRCNLTRGRRARRGNGIGNASCGCPVCTVLGGATYSVVKVLLRLVGADSRGCVTISAASIRRASSAGAPIRGDVPRVRRHCPFGKRIICDGTGLKLALVESIAHAFWPVSRGSTKGDCQNQYWQDFGIFRIGLWLWSCVSCALTREKLRNYNASSARG